MYEGVFALGGRTAVTFKGAPVRFEARSCRHRLETLFLSFQISSARNSLNVRNRNADPPAHPCQSDVRLPLRRSCLLTALGTLSAGH